MLASKCPGQDTRYWKAEDIHEQPCPHCGTEIEFWKTDLRLRCPKCGRKVTNERFNLGCAQWCAYAEQCLGGVARGEVPLTLRQVLEETWRKISAGTALKPALLKERLDRAEEACRATGLDPLPALAAVAALSAGGEVNSFLDQLAADSRVPAGAIEEARRIVENVRAGRIAGKLEKLAAALSQDHRDKS